MPRQNDIDEAKRAVSLLFSRMGVKRVVCVDDIYAESATDEEIISSCKILRLNEGLKAINGLAEIPFDDDSDDGAVWETKLKDFLKDMDVTQKITLFSEIQKLRSSEENSSSLGEIIAPVEFKKLSPQAWPGERDALIAAAKVENTLFLFDRYLKPGDNTDKGGEELLKDFLGRDQKSPCGILSQTITEEKEHDLWKEFCKQAGVDGSRFVFVSKSRLSDVPMSFPNMLRLMLLNHQFEKIKTNVLEVMDKANEFADTTIKDFDIYQIEQFLFKSAETEGVWEPDTLVRLHWLYQRKFAMPALRNLPDVHNAASEVRGVRKGMRIPLKGTEAWKVLRLENYEDGKMLNSVLSPLDLGDIFEIYGISDKKFILIAQPCDLMVRPDGTRNDEGRIGCLVEIGKTKPPRDQFQLWFELKHLLPDNEATWYVYFNKSYNINLKVLDTASTNSNGNCELILSGDGPMGLIPAWQEKLKRLIGEFARVSAVLHALDGNQEAINMILKGAFYIESPFPPPQFDYDNPKVSFRIKRFARLVSPKAQELLIRYSQFLSRFAFEHDLAKAENNDLFVAPTPGETDAGEPA